MQIELNCKLNNVFFQPFARNSVAITSNSTLISDYLVTDKKTVKMPKASLGVNVSYCPIIAGLSQKFARWIIGNS